MLIAIDVAETKSLTSPIKYVNVKRDSTASTDSVEYVPMDIHMMRRFSGAPVKIHAESTKS